MRALRWWPRTVACDSYPPVSWRLNCANLAAHNLSQRALSHEQPTWHQRACLRVWRGDKLCSLLKRSFVPTCHSTNCRKLASHVALEQLPDLSYGSLYTGSAAPIALGTGATCQTPYMVEFWSMRALRWWPRTVTCDSYPPVSWRQNCANLAAHNLSQRALSHEQPTWHQRACLRVWRGDMLCSLLKSSFVQTCHSANCQKLASHVALEQLPDLSNSSPYTASAAAIALGTGATCKTTYVVRVPLEYARIALVATHRHM